MVSLGWMARNQIARVDSRLCFDVGKSEGIKLNSPDIETENIGEVRRLEMTVVDDTVSSIDSRYSVGFEKSTSKLSEPSVATASDPRMGSTEGLRHSKIKLE